MVFSSPTSRRPSGYDEENKKKRNRKALSCIQCKTRKIKCDRGEPQCQSCITRGIRGECKYGSLPEERESSKSSRKNSQTLHRHKRRSVSSTDRNGSPDVDHIVNAVLKRLKRRRSSITSQSSSDSEQDESEDRENSTRKSSVTTNALTSSSPAKKSSNDLMEMLYYNVKIAPNAVARKVHFSAFGGFRAPNPFFPYVLDPNTLVNSSDLLTSLKRLPPRIAVERLVDVYLQDLEPARCLFNTQTLLQQMKEFWQDYDLLLIQANQLSPSEGNSQALQLRTSIVDKDDKTRNNLRTLPRQGFLAVLFRLLEAGGRVMSLDEKVRIGILPIGAEEEAAFQWYDTMGDASALHAKASQSDEIPTIWTLQLLKLNDFRTATMVRSSLEKHAKINGPLHLQQSNVVAMQICISLGLNRLGSGYDDAAEPVSTSQRVPETEVGSIFAEHIVAQSNSLPNKQQLLTSSMKFGSSIAIFEEGNIPNRELGRKIWSNVVSMDALFSGHINQHHYINNSVDRTAPPLALTDEDLFSPHLSLLASQCRPDGARINENVYSAYAVAFSKILRQMVEWENEKGAPLPYEDTLILDKRFFDLMEGLPPFLSINAPVSQNPDDAERRVMLQRGLLNDQSHFRLIHIHRAFLGKGFKDEKYRRSIFSCLKAAHGVLEARKVLEKAGCVFVRSVFLESHLIHASLVFQLVLLHELDRPHQDKQSSGRKNRANETEAGFGLIDIDKTIVILEECLELLNPSSELPSLREYVPGLKSFLKGAKERIRRQRGEHHDTSDAANILASMPTSSVPHNERQAPSTDPTYSNQSQYQQGWPLTNMNGSGQVIDAATNGDLDVPSLNVYDPSIWSLDALFPNYMDGGIDLIAALENELMFTGSGSR
ncbi:uncharacterized protein FA14DRAFT_76978 [Meira miltonrushii]|uniref:Zn(2)-C6 fungal-type domain-containing protein n=1 Tax=Meira miltonrushii TaxID=1280837 RepID=A0A316V5G4_9BASI|nr:uncharacterized protein FA14DRAFT_76978 [Meira miltonrushii]PWN32702.1 hypothetical protein FA14DRAFT_76978 [Meira miltonrushii]